MLFNYTLKLHPPTPLRPKAEWGYRLYAALLEQVSQELGDAVHKNEITPISQFLELRGAELYWHVSIFGDEACEHFDPILSEATHFLLKQEGLAMEVMHRDVVRIQDAEELLQLGLQQQDSHRLRICTPVAFKSRGQYITIPSTYLILQNLVKKWNGCFPESPIEDEEGEGEGLQALAEGLSISHFHIKDRSYWLKGTPIPGFIGELILTNQLDGFHRQLASTLLIFAQYAGVGIKTTLGMGGITIIG